MTSVQETAKAFALAPDAQDLLFREARTANTFTDEPVSDEQVQAIYDKGRGRINSRCASCWCVPRRRRNGC